MSCWTATSPHYDIQVLLTRFIAGRLKAQICSTKPRWQNILELRKKSEFPNPLLALTSHFLIQNHICYPCEVPGCAPRFQNKRREVGMGSYAGSGAVKIFLVPATWLIFPSAPFGCQSIIQNEADFSKCPHGCLHHQEDKCSQEKNFLIFFYGEKGLGAGLEEESMDQPRASRVLGNCCANWASSAAQEILSPKPWGHGNICGMTF